MTTSPFAVPFTAEAALVGIDRPFLSGDEALRITSFNSAAGVTLAIEGRYITPDARVVAQADRHVPNTDRSVATSLLPLGQGWLLDVVVRASGGSPRLGQCFVVLELVKGNTGAVQSVALLAQGYVTDTQKFGYPGSPIMGSTDGRGNMRSVTGTDPAAGAEISETVPTNARWRVHGIDYALVTDGTAANRESTLVFDDGTTIHTASPSGVNHAASTTRNYSAFHAATRGAAATAPRITMPLPVLDLPGGSRIRTVTTNIQAGDNYGAPQLLVEEWIED